MGAAGAALINRFLSESYFKNQSILVLNNIKIEEINKKWSFWTKNNNYCELNAIKKWEFAFFKSNSFQTKIDLKPYIYQTIDAKTYLKTTLNKIESAQNVTYELDTVQKTQELETEVLIYGHTNCYEANLVFDSRIDNQFHKDQKFTHILQHFKGWIIETEEEAFDDTTFSMMDFKSPYKEQCSFMYVLPFTKKSALFEFTFFDQNLVDEIIYDSKIKEYLIENYPTISYKIKETEYGVVPMSDYPFEKHSSQKVIKIGTAGGWATPSSGYSFYNSLKFSDLIAESLKLAQPIDLQPWRKKNRWYDAIFIEVLARENSKGAHLFSLMYQKNPIDRIFRFLNGESSLKDDILIILSFPPKPFLKALLSKLFR